MSLATRDFMLLIGAVVVGTVAGILVSRLAGEGEVQARLPEGDRAVGVQLAIDRLDDSIRRLDARLDRLDEALVGLEGSVRDGTSETSPGAQVSEATANAKEAVDWAAALDQRLARLLLERGLTPFDAGVSGPLTIAGRKLREALDRKNDRLKALIRDREQKLFDQETHGRRVSIVFEEDEETRRAVLAACEKALDALAAQD